MTRDTESRDGYVVDQIMDFMERSDMDVVRLDAEEMYDTVVEAGMHARSALCDDIERDRDELEQANEQLREALRPFAQEITSEVPDDHRITIQWPDVSITAGDLRRAREVLARCEQKRIIPVATSKHDDEGGMSDV